MAEVGPSDSEKGTPAKRRPRKKQHDIFEKVTLGVGIVGLVVLIAYTVAAFWQVHLLKQQIADARASGDASSRQTDHAIEASIINGATAAYQAALTARALKLAEDNAHTAQGQLATAQDTERRQLRPYAYVALEYVRGLEAGQTPTYSLHVGVTGLTPAHDLTLRTYTGVKPASVTHLDPVKIPKGTPITRTVVHPGNTFPQKASFTGPIPQSIANDIAANRQHAFVWGVVRYRDSFGTPYYTDFCNEFGGSAGDVSGSAEFGKTCAFGNDAN